MTLIIRCSSIGKLMATPDASDLDPSLVDDGIRAILAKKKRTDAEQSELDEIRRKSLSAGGKSHVRQLLRESIYGYEPPDLKTKPILKGLAVEAACIDLLAKLTNKPLKKNSERRSNGFISGECDVWDPSARHGYDIKAPWSMETMPVVLADCHDSNYYWQMQGYQILWEADSWSVEYMLVTTPDDLIGGESNAVHFVDHIPAHQRRTSWLVERDLAAVELITNKVMAARRYFSAVANEFDRTHQLAPQPSEYSKATGKRPAVTLTTEIPLTLF